MIAQTLSFSPILIGFVTVWDCCRGSVSNHQLITLKGVKAAVVISADLELAWAWRYSKKSDDPKVLALQKAHQTRQNLPPLLDLFDQFNVPVTWATVGHLFLEECGRTNGRAHSDLPRPPYFENEFWRYAAG